MTFSNQRPAHELRSSLRWSERCKRSNGAKEVVEQKDQHHGDYMNLRQLRNWQFHEALNGRR